MQSIAIRVKQWQSASWQHVAWLLFCVALFDGGKLLGKLAKGIPGHSVAFWLPALFIARGMVNRPGAATMTALLGSALWCLPKGDGFFDIASFVAAGLTLDALMEKPERLRSLLFALAVGALAGLVKFGFHLIPALILAETMHSLRLGAYTVGALHFAFGALGGGLGWAALRKLRRDDPAG